MNKQTVSFTAGVAFITLLTGLAWGVVGSPNSCGEIYPWYLPINMLIVLAFPFLLGYWSSK